ncbi:MAG: PLP-dependent aminotransferase family protein [Anaerolineae bacterium]|nr:PLP-dependent aminotransferase family protein [Phycisphaerae bacterium]
MAQATASKEFTLYEKVVDRIVDLIDHGTLRPGAKLPSVRKLSQQLDVSISTVLQAYRILEDRGKISAKPQSGYYVRTDSWKAPPEPRGPRTKSCASCEVSMGERVRRVYAAMANPSVVRLGAAVAGWEILPTRQLNRLMAAIARRAPSQSSNYDLPPGCEALRVQIARRAMEAGCALAPDDIITTVGSSEALALCLRTVARPGDTIAIESPTFYGILQTIELLGMKAVEIPTHPREGVDLDALESAIDHDDVHACLFITNFNNPLGSCMPAESKRRLVQMLAEREVPLIEDDVYGELPFDDAHGRPSTCKSFDTDGNVMLVSSFSKTLAPGLRIGWCAPGRWRDEVLRAKLFTTLATPTIPQLAIAEMLANGGFEHHLRRMRKIFRDNVGRMTQAIVAHFPAETRLTRPAGGFVLWVELPEQVDGMTLHDRAIAEHISIAPGEMFSPTPHRFDHFIRINCGQLWTEKTERAIATLGKLIREAM